MARRESRPTIAYFADGPFGRARLPSSHLLGIHGSRPLDTRAQLRYQSRTRMADSARIYFIVFGILTIVGGLIGFLKAKSTISLVSGGISGALLLVAAYLFPTQFMAGVIIALLVSVLLAGRFVPNLIRTGKIMPDAMMSILSVIGVVVAVLAWLKK